MNDTLSGLIIPFIAPAIGIFMMRQFITSVPDELIQAARSVVFVGFVSFL